MLKFLASRLGNVDRTNGGTQIPDRSEYRPTPDLEPDASWNHKTRVGFAHKPNTSFFLTSPQDDDPRRGISQDPSQPRKRTKSGETVKTGECDFSFHSSQDLSPGPNRVKFLKSLYSLKHTTNQGSWPIDA